MYVLIISAWMTCRLRSWISCRRRTTMVRWWL